MHTQDSSGFVRSRLPWILAVAALALYAATANAWVSLANLTTISSFTHASSRTPLTSPVFFLITLPVHLLPASIQIATLNFLTAAFAALTLAQLARTVSLLPHDRTREERHRETDQFSLLTGPMTWIPPVLATLLLALQFTFWQHATSASGEMLDLLLFAYCFRCLLEYRAGARDSWLYRLSFVYGLATTNNWAMIGFFPIVLAAILWLRGWQFFQARFLIRMTLLGLAGLSLYLLLPILTTIRGDLDITLWQALQLELATQKAMLLARPLRLIALIAALTSVIPLIITAIRWPSTTGDTSAVGSLIANYLFRVLYPLLFVAGLITAAELFAQGSRIQLNRLSPSAPIPGLSFLTFHYLGALALGYFIGYFILAFGRREERARHRGARNAAPLGKPVLALLLTLACATIAYLGWQNLPAIRTENSPVLRDFARRLLTPVPQGSSILLSDNDIVYALARIHLAEHFVEPKPLLISTRLLETARYHRDLHRQAPNQWPDIPADVKPTARIRQDFFSAQLALTARSNQVHYLHPSFGYYFEASYLVSRGLLHTLLPYEANQITPPTPPQAVTAGIIEFWNSTLPTLASLEAAIQHRSSSATFVGRIYSLSLNHCGVFLQRSGANLLPQAQRLFLAAQRLNPDNLAAQINLACNERLQRNESIAQLGIESTAKPGTSFMDRFANTYRGWDDALAADGPIDHPRFCETLGTEAHLRGLQRRATIELLRSLHLDPSSISTKIALASTYAAVTQLDALFSTLADAEKSLTQSPVPQIQEDTYRDQIARLKAIGLHSQGDAAAAETTLLDASRKRPNSIFLTIALLELYESVGQPQKALDLIDRTLTSAKDPNPWLLAKANVHAKARQYNEAILCLTQALARDNQNQDALLHLGAVYIQSKNFTNAIAPLDTLLQLNPQNRAARLNRAIARLQIGELDQSQKDYLTLLKDLPDLHSIQYGLADIAARRKQTAKAIEHYESYLRLAPPETPEAREVAARLQALKTGSK